MFDSFLEEFSQKIGLAEDAARTLMQTYDTVKEHPLYTELSQMLSNTADFKQLEERCMAAAQTLGIHHYTFMMTLLCGNVRLMKARYLESGVKEKIFWDTAVDFRCKIEECKRVYGVWGIFAFEWYRFLFEAKIFKLGRLEFERREDGNIGIHIPSCGPLDYEEVLDSYRRAYAFFGGFEGEPMPLLCHSYLLFPAYQENVFAETSNIHRFVKDFQIIRVDESKVFRDAWRVYGTFYNGDVSVLPQNTSLQRAFTAYIKKGGAFGVGLGLLLIDGKTVRTDRHDLIEKYAKPYR